MTAAARASVGPPLELPGYFDGILDGSGVASGEVRDDHHVPGIPGRNAEGSGELPQ